MVQHSRFGAAWTARGGGLGSGRFGRRAVVGLQFDALRPSEAQIAAPGGAGEQVFLQRERAEHAALHAKPDGREIVGAEEDGAGCEFRGVDAGGDCGGEVPSVGDEGGEDAENSPDTPRDGAGFGGRRGGWGCLGHSVCM